MRFAREFRMLNNVHIIKGDITQIAVGAIVNAANTSLLGGGGVDGAIHRCGGPAILDECRQIRARQGGCDVGKAVITTAGKLPADYIIHTVGPRWCDGQHNEPALLDECYQSCFALLKEYNVKSVSFPNISTGIYHFPKPLAAQIALMRIAALLESQDTVKYVNIVCFEEQNAALYQEVLGLMRV